MSRINMTPTTGSGPYLGMANLDDTIDPTLNLWGGNSMYECRNTRANWATPNLQFIDKSLIRSVDSRLVPAVNAANNLRGTASTEKATTISYDSNNIRSFFNGTVH